MASLLNLLKLYTIIGFCLILSVSDNYLNKIKILPIPSTAFSLAFLMSLLFGIILRAILNKAALNQLLSVLRNNQLIILPFGLIVFLSLLGAINTGAYWGSGGAWIFLYSYDFIILLLAMLTPCIPFVRNNFRYFCLLALIMALWAIWSDVMSPGTFSVEANRPAGFSGNSNWGALSLVMLCVGALSFNAHKNLTLDLAALALAGFGIFHTLSRSGLLNFAFLVATYIILTFFSKGGNSKRGFYLVFTITGFALLFILTILFNYENDEISVGSRSKDRLKGFLQGELVDDGSSDARKEAALHALSLLNEAPIFGHGTGHSREMPEKPHNLFLNQGVNNGFLGIIAYLLLLLGSFLHFWRFNYQRGITFVGIVFIASFFSHNILDQRTFLLLLGYMATASWMPSIKPNYS